MTTSGRVVDSAGNPLKDVRVFAYDPVTGLRIGDVGVTDSNGVYQFNIPYNGILYFSLDGFNNVVRDSLQVSNLVLKPGYNYEPGTGELIPVTFSKAKNNNTWMWWVLAAGVTWYAIK